ncbi:hypothetical protein FOQG_18530 [Fusarium oxysporum f. sp. raphani 54005]|uniref:Uncharacterized protein n=1 Tax=Fusarium oxysporum f. sp. raphani 54005 TaxID=1089458 RepID=X0BD50_FUSOX|nr:hypothetical protein FOQG_18530 [Fusarium oxysporum f. sp. raphani 54005]
MAITTAKVTGIKQVIARTPPIQGKLLNTTIPAAHFTSTDVLNSMVAAKGIPVSVRTRPSIPNAYLVKTGWAVRPTTKTIRDKIIASRAEILRTQGASAVETATKWYTYAVAKCPIEVYDHEGN